MASVLVTHMRCKLCYSLVERHPKHQSLVQTKGCVIRSVYLTPWLFSPLFFSVINYPVASRKGKMYFQTKVTDLAGSSTLTSWAIKYIILLATAHAVLIILCATAYFLHHFKQMPGLWGVIKQDNNGRTGRFCCTSKKQNKKDLHLHKPWEL